MLHWHLPELYQQIVAAQACMKSDGLKCLLDKPYLSYNPRTLSLQYVIGSEKSFFGFCSVQLVAPFAKLRRSLVHLFFNC